VDGARPFVVSIDGVAFEEWVRVAQQYVVDGSAAVELRRGLRQAEAVNLVRERLGVPPSGRAVVGFAREGAADVVLREFELGREATRSAQVERAAEELEDGVLYLRLETMALEDKDLEWLSDQLDRAAGLRGLLIDVRGNGGGSRDATRAVLERLVHRVEGGARVVNAARPRAWDERTGAPDSLSNRYLWPADWEGWSDRERAAIERFGKEFEPSWAPGDGFGSWRYFVVSEPVEGVKRVEGPVVVLMDAGCFSATDIFLGALKGVPGVTLVGSASSGGSARSRGHRVEGLNTELRLASMVSYQPSGLLYDGVGIEPDVVVRPTAACLIGRSDVQFERAVEILHDQLRED